MYHTFQNDDVKRAYTEFVLIHTGYPYHHHVAALLSQFPNVHTDVSFYAVPSSKLATRQSGA
jgi:predicted TIM-barrel fold metal-dependent hydrolase